MGLNLNAGSVMSKITSGLTSNKLAGKTSFNTSNLDTITNTLSGKSKVQLKNYTYQYQVKKLQLIIPDEEEPFTILKEAINQIVITREYDKAIHPVLEIITLLPPPIHSKMVKHKNDCIIRLKIKKAKYNKNGEFISSKDWINDSFQIIIDDDSDWNDETMYTKMNGGSNKPGHGKFNIKDYTDEYTLSLWKQSDIEAMRSVVNAIKADATISTVIADIYGKSGIKKILISPLDNDKSYSEIRIPPMNLMNLPDYLQKIYGTYYSGTTVFLDFRCLYFLSRNGVCDAKEDDEYTRTVFKVPKVNNAKTKSPGTSEDKENRIYYMNVDNASITFVSPSASTDAISGNNVAVIDSNKNETLDIKGAGTQRGTGNSKVTSDNYSNEFNKASMLSKIVEESSQAIIELTDYDEEALTPNKEFIIAFDDSKMKNRNGFYRVTESQVILSKGKSDLQIFGKHIFAFKANIGYSGQEEKEVTATQVKTTNVTSEASKENEKEKTEVKTPQGKLDTMQTTTQTNNSENKVANNPNYTYDSLGNVQGVDIPEYNKITENDDVTVVNAKRKAQKNSLPCSGPQAKLKQ